ncbi:hypothetical protein PG999_000337 [Apiospora kogelbergensis]|uniref:Uncharacterized protein n=1 Tax=Apiospora kogelbergensis TaxID=1337665 RepID=A0AAW0RBI4_9PEZI
MSANQPPNSAAVQLPLDLTIYNNRADYFDACEFNYILLQVLKSRDGIVTNANVKITEAIEDMCHIVRKELANVGSFMTLDIIDAEDDLRGLGRSEHEIEAAKVYLESQPCPGIASHGKIRESVTDFEAKVRGLIKIPPAPDAKTVSDNKAVPSQASLTSTPSVNPADASADGHRPQPPAPALVAHLPLHPNTSTGDTPTKTEPITTTDTPKTKPGNLPVKPAVKPATKPTKKPAAKPAAKPTVTTDTKKHSLPEKVTFDVKQDNKRPRIRVNLSFYNIQHCVPKRKLRELTSLQGTPNSNKTIPLGDLVPGEVPVMINGDFHVLRCPDRFLKTRPRNGINPVENPKLFMYDAQNGHASLDGTQFTLDTVMEHLAWKVVDAGGLDVIAEQLRDAGFKPDFFF